MTNNTCAWCGETITDGMVFCNPECQDACMEAYHLDMQLMQQEEKELPEGLDKPWWIQSKLPFGGVYQILPTGTDETGISKAQCARKGVYYDY